MTSLAQSYLLCQRFARTSRSNFYYCFYFLPREKRRAMYALYAFLRRADDIGDAIAVDDIAGRGPEARYGVDTRRRHLIELRRGVQAALGGQYVDPYFPALTDAIRRFQIPPDYLYAVIDGVEMDLTPRTYETFGDLQEYCERVASVVGQACIHIWGFSGHGALELARQCGLAFQLTNILRDIEEDLARGRIYLPSSDLRCFGYTADDLRHGVLDDRFRALFQFEVDRTENFFRSASELHGYLHKDGQLIYSAMFRTYHRLLDKIRRSNGGSLRSRVQLDFWEKLRTAVEAIVVPLDRFYRVQSSSPAAP